MSNIYGNNFCLYDSFKITIPEKFDRTFLLDFIHYQGDFINSSENYNKSGYIKEKISFFEKEIKGVVPGKEFYMEIIKVKNKGISRKILFDLIKSRNAVPLGLNGLIIALNKMWSSFPQYTKVFSLSDVKRGIPGVPIKGIPNMNLSFREDRRGEYLRDVDINFQDTRVEVNNLILCFRDPVLSSCREKTLAVDGLSCLYY